MTNFDLPWSVYLIPFAIASVLWLLFTLAASIFCKVGREFWVNDERGDDRYEGTEERPFKTLHRAMLTAGKDDTIWVSGGKYCELVESRGPNVAVRKSE